MRTGTPGLVTEWQPSRFSVAGPAAFVYHFALRGFRPPVLQAMACGVPVLASARSSIPEIPGGVVVLFDPCSEEDLAQKFVLVLTDEGVGRDRVKADWHMPNVSLGRAATGRTHAIYHEAVRERSIRAALKVS